MMQKKGSFLGFTGIEVFRFVGSALSFIVLIIIAFGILAIWGPKEKAEAASLSLMEDLRAKLSRLDDGDSVIVSGFLDKDVRLVSFNSDYFQKDIDNGILRPSKCGSRSNSCICLCKDDRCTNVLECKGFSRQQVETISSVSAAEHWMPVTTTVVSGGRYDGDTPVKENVDIINYLAANNPSPAGSYGLPLQLKSPDSNGIYTYRASGATQLYYHYTGSYWEWSPDKLNWMPSSTTVVSGGKWEGQEPVQENRDIIHYLDQYNPVPGQVGIPPQLGQPNSNGIYAYDAGVYATPLYYHYTGGSWQWSPDWNEVTEMVIAKGETSFVGKFSLEGTSLRVERIN